MKGILNLSPKTMEHLTDALVDSLVYSDSKLSYPSLDNVRADDGLPAEWFYKAVNGSNSTSELTAIMQYTNQEAQFESIGELTLGIALVEMKHYGKLSELIAKLGGRVDSSFSAKSVESGKTPIEALTNDIRSEEATIKEYESLYNKIDKIEDKTPTIEVALQLIAKITADERLHIQLLNKMLKDMKAFSQSSEK